MAIWVSVQRDNSLRVQLFLKTAAAYSHLFFESFEFVSHWSFSYTSQMLRGKSGTREPPSLFCIQLLLGFGSIFKGKEPFFHLRI